MSVASAVAAIDCGSNSTRALIVDAEGRAVAREMTITRLAEGVDESGVLGESAMQRTLTVLDRYRALCDEWDVATGLLVATSAVRDASNGGEFLDRAHRVVGFEATVLTGDQEAAYSLVGASTGLVTVATPTVIVDIGGGSTELATEVEGVRYSHSMQLGCVRVTERALGRGVVTAARDAAAVEMIDRELERAFLDVPFFTTLVGSLRLVGLAGTVATLAQLDAGLSAYDRDVVHHRRLTRFGVQYWRDLLASETPAQRLGHAGMVLGREDVLVAGLYILDAVMARLGVEELLSSESDILDGITTSLQSR